ncbi:MAG: sigma-54 dependent transcriptional regulator [Bacteriovoracaceae bacterium]
MTKRILIIEDDKYLRLHLLDILSRYGLLEEASSFKEAKALITQNHYDIVVTDIELGDGISLELLPLIRLKGSKCIVISSHQEEDFIERAYNLGAQHFLSKQQIRKDLPHYIELLHDDKKREIDLFFERDFVTQDEGLKSEIQSLSQIDFSNRNIFITGPSGVGKSHLGKLIHKLSNSKGELVHINCSEIPENLLESELFGHVKGAFTGAEKERVGKLTLAHKGTLFLDEVGTMSLSMQQKLLKAIDEKTYYPVGSNIPQKIEFTLITATCENLEEKIVDKSFREDFFYRINGININIPALRYREADIDLLVAKFIKESSRKFIIKSEALKIMRNLPWSGNARELFKFLERIQDSGIGIISAKNINDFIHKNQEPIINSDVNQILSIGLKEYIHQIERMAVIESMKRNNGKVTNCIKELKISASAFYRILKEVETTN